MYSIKASSGDFNPKKFRLFIELNRLKVCILYFGQLYQGSPPQSFNILYKPCKWYNVFQIGMNYVLILDPGVSGSEKAGSYPPYDQGLKQGVFVMDGKKPFVGKVSYYSSIIPYSWQWNECSDEGYILPLGVCRSGIQSRQFSPTLRTPKWCRIGATNSKSSITKSTLTEFGSWVVFKTCQIVLWDGTCCNL